MKELLRAVQNLTYVTIDRDAAKDHWVKCADAMASRHADNEQNRKLFLVYKATAGLLGHKRTRNFRIYSMRERNIIRNAGA